MILEGVELAEEEEEFDDMMDSTNDFDFSGGGGDFSFSFSFDKFGSSSRSTSLIGRDFDTMMAGIGEVFVSQFKGSPEEHAAAAVIQGHCRYFLLRKQRAERKRLEAKFTGTPEEQMAAVVIQGHYRFFVKSRLAMTEVERWWLEEKFPGSPEEVEAARRIQAWYRRLLRLQGKVRRGKRATFRRSDSFRRMSEISLTSDSSEPDPLMDN
uniref:Uncharacterized protein n=1 Tax=Pyramimonas obovata TaxID=1411642 RepID=A0A7S0WMM3_9CHLO|mmetsp:Transcript_30931/g.67571  ORF Transcript_30931/g.67571 Transcript_30931/m.67571 type:complete len:210 (+) Transcript_30931:2-631(+)